MEDEKSHHERISALEHRVSDLEEKLERRVSELDEKLKYSAKSAEQSVEERVEDQFA